MLNLTYWGAGGQFGPFAVQEDGWPNAGQVMRYFREKSGLTAKAFGELYGKRIREDSKPICERWILEMELENKVPLDITRRRVIVQLLQIPPALLGLASLQEIASSSGNSFPLTTSTVNTAKNPLLISQSMRKIFVLLYICTEQVVRGMCCMISLMKGKH